MCNHSFEKTIREDLLYCSKCGSLLKDNHTLLIKPIEYNTPVEFDPINALTYRISIEKAKSFEAIVKSYNINYLQVRKQGINQIKLLIKLLHFKPLVQYKAILYMDSIFSTWKISTSLMKDVALICVLFAQQYNEKCPNSKIEDLLKYLQTIRYFKELEILCLQCLDYNLGIESAYDYLITIFSLGITTSNNVKEIKRLYISCFRFLDNLITDNRFLDFSSSELAFTIIRYKCEGSPLFALKFFEGIFNINYKESRLMTCLFILSIIEQVNQTTFVLQRNPMILQLNQQISQFAIKSKAC